MFTLIKNANIYAPESLGIKDVLITYGKIARIDTNICVSGLPELQVIDAKKQVMVPGFIDGHVHLIGGGGEGGFKTRSPEVMLSRLTRAGITTAVGLLGTDGSTRHNASLYAKTKALTSEGISAYMFTGGYGVPSHTITASIGDDISFVDTVIGLKTAISDHRSSHPTVTELIRMASEARVAGMIAGKCGRIVVHLGGSLAGFKPLLEVVEQSEIPINQFIPTHVNRKAFLMEQGREWLQQGGYIDLSSGINPDKGAKGGVKAASAIAQCVKEGLDLSMICLSSDGNGSTPVFDSQGQLTGLKIAGFDSLLSEFQDMVRKENLSISNAITPLTNAPAACLGLADSKGEIAVGKDADVLLLDAQLNISHTIASGELMVENGDILRKGFFES